MRSPRRSSDTRLAVPLMRLSGASTRPAMSQPTAAATRSTPANAIAYWSATPSRAPRARRRAVSGAPGWWGGAASYPVADALHGLDHRRRAELPAQAEDGHADRVRERVGVLVPHPGDELVVRHHAAARRHQGLEDGELLGRQVDRAAVALDGVSGGVELEVAGAQGGREWRVRAAGQGVEAGDELVEGERLGHVVVGAEREAVHEVLRAGGSGEHQHPGVVVLVAERAAHLVAVHDREVAVEHHDVVAVQARLVESGGAVVGDVDGHALAAQPARDGVRDPAFVLGDEHPHLRESNGGSRPRTPADAWPLAVVRRYLAVTFRRVAWRIMSDIHLQEEPREALESALFEIKRVIIGQDAMLERVMVALLTGGHVLLEGVPGLAKTLTIKTLASVVGGTFSRIQFTPDLVPSDLVGTRIYRPDSGRFDTELGPVFANFLLADEINRAPAKVQSALLEVMQEQQVTIGGDT